MDRDFDGKFTLGGQPGPGRPKGSKNKPRQFQPKEKPTTNEIQEVEEYLTTLIRQAVAHINQNRDHIEELERQVRYLKILNKVPTPSDN